MNFNLKIDHLPVHFYSTRSTTVYHYAVLGLVNGRLTRLKSKPNQPTIVLLVIAVASLARMMMPVSCADAGFSPNSTPELQGDGGSTLGVFGCVGSGGESLETYQGYKYCNTDVPSGKGTGKSGITGWSRPTSYNSDNGYRHFDNGAAISFNAIEYSVRCLEDADLSMHKKEGGPKELIKFDRGWKKNMSKSTVYLHMEERKSSTKKELFARKIPCFAARLLHNLGGATHSLLLLPWIVMLQSFAGAAFATSSAYDSCVTQVMFISKTTKSWPVQLRKTCTLSSGMCARLVAAIFFVLASPAGAQTWSSRCPNGATGCSGPVSNWDTSKVTSMNHSKSKYLSDPAL